MQIRGAAPAHRLQVEALHDVEHLERRHSLGIRRQLEHLVAAIRRGDRLNPVRVMIGEIFQRDQPVATLHFVRNRFGDGALVEHVASALGDLLE